VPQIVEQAGFHEWPYPTQWDPESDEPPPRDFEPEWEELTAAQGLRERTAITSYTVIGPELCTVNFPSMFGPHGDEVRRLPYPARDMGSDGRRRKRRRGAVRSGAVHQGGMRLRRRDRAHAPQRPLRHQRLPDKALEASHRLHRAAPPESVSERQHPGEVLASRTETHSNWTACGDGARVVGVLQALMIYVVMAMTLAVTAGWVAERRGRNFWVYFVVCAVLPIAALVSIPYLVVFGRRVQAAE
jgi:hypothetical protein